MEDSYGHTAQLMQQHQPLHHQHPPPLPDPPPTLVFASHHQGIFTHRCQRTWLQLHTLTHRDEIECLSSVSSPAKLDGRASSCIPGFCEMQHLAVESPGRVSLCRSWSWFNFSFIVGGLKRLLKGWSEVQKAWGRKTGRILWPLDHKTGKREDAVNRWRLL